MLTSKVRMKSPIFAGIGLCLMAPLACWAQAQDAAAAKNPLLNAGQAPTQLTAPSIFSSYENFKPEPVQSWRTSNARVHQVGGWRSYTRQAHEPDSASAEAPPRSETKP